MLLLLLYNDTYQNKHARGLPRPDSAVALPYTVLALPRPADLPYPALS